MKPGDDKPLQKLEHEPVAGYRKIFAAVFAVLGLYLAWILYSSPGQIEHKETHGKKEEPSHH